jgi:hypothetical protein
VRENAAFEIGAEFLLDVPWKAFLVVPARLFEKVFEVLPDDAIENRGFGSAALVQGRGDVREAMIVAGAAPSHARCMSEKQAKRV